MTSDPKDDPSDAPGVDPIPALPRPRRRSPVRSAAAAGLAALASSGTGVVSAIAPVDPVPAQALAPAAWLAGCWENVGREAGSGEQWMAPAGGAMLGLSRTLRGGAMREFEFMVIRADGAGRLSYSAWPSGRGPTVFTQPGNGASAADTLVFENLAHDFPQRIVYRRDGPDRITARIEGQRDGVLRGLDFPMRRVACP